MMELLSVANLYVNSASFVTKFNLKLTRFDHIAAIYTQTYVVEKNNVNRRQRQQLYDDDSSGDRIDVLPSRNAAIMNVASLVLTGGRVAPPPLGILAAIVGLAFAV
jgi:hypothetical protein